MNDRICSPPIGWMSLYKEYFHTRVRFSLHPFFCALFNFWMFHQSLIVPNSWQHNYSFTTICILARIEPIFHFSFFSIFKKHPRSCGWWYTHAHWPCIQTPYDDQDLPSFLTITPLESFHLAFYAMISSLNNRLRRLHPFRIPWKNLLVASYT